VNSLFRVLTVVTAEEDVVLVPRLFLPDDDNWEVRLVSAAIADSTFVFISVNALYRASSFANSLYNV